MDRTSEDVQPLLHGTVRISDGETGNKVILYPRPSDSPDDPLNWSIARKIWSASIVLFIVALTAATSNSLGAAGTALEADYNLSFNVQNTATGVLFIGIGYGTLLLSSAPFLYGRRSSYLCCLLFSIIGNCWFPRLRGTGDLIGSQLFIGASEAVAEATAQLSLFDLFFMNQRGVVLGLYVLATSVGTFLGPLISGYIADSPLSWPWIGWLAVIVSGVTFVVTYFTFEETAFERGVLLGGTRDGEAVTEPLPHRPVGGDPYGEKAGDADPARTVDYGVSGDLMQPPRKTYWQRIALITPASTLQGLGFKQYFLHMWNNIKIFSIPAVLYAGVQWGFQDAWLTFYLTAEDDNWTSPPYNYGDAAESIMLVPTLIGSVIGCIYGGYFSDVFVRWIAKRNGGIFEAEERLWLMLPPAVLCPVGLIVFGWGTNNVWPWPAPYVALGLIGFGWGCAGDLSLAYAMDAYPDMILEGMVGVSVINNTLACIFTFACSQWMDVHSVAEVFTTIGIVAIVVMLPLTIFMIIYGKRLRRWSSPRYEKFLKARG